MVIGIPESLFVYSSQGCSCFHLKRVYPTDVPWSNLEKASLDGEGSRWYEGLRGKRVNRAKNPETKLSFKA